MNSYFLKDYSLTSGEVLQSLVVSEYGLRHLNQAEVDPQRKWGHRLIALIEFIPVIGQLAMVIEWVAYQIFGKHAGKSIQNERLFAGSQVGAVGPVPRQGTLAVVERLQRFNERGIQFNPTKVTGHVEGGVCSAMSFDFAEAFLRLKRGQGTPDPFLEKMRQLRPRFAQSSEAMRIRQAAFNTIEVRRDFSGADLRRAKVQAIANLHGFKIDDVSTQLDVCAEDGERQVKEQVARLSDGLYVLRTIKPANNEKLEEHGHSMIYVKEGKEGFFYDPNQGAFHLVGKHARTLNATLQMCFQLFQTSEARFYRIASFQQAAPSNA